ILDGGNNIDADPVFVSTTPGGTGYVQLDAGSPAIEAGNNTYYSDAGGDLANDLDLAGNPRVYDFADGGIIDMGAYEYQGTVNTPPAVTTSGGLTAFIESVDGALAPVAIDDALTVTD